jgi:hypothetical protein
MLDYLNRVSTVVEVCRAFRCAPLESLSSASFDVEATVGLGPYDLEDGDLIAILFGLSVPVVLRSEEIKPNDVPRYRLTGMCYVHEYMEGEVFSALTSCEVAEKAMQFCII